MKRNPSRTSSINDRATTVQDQTLTIQEREKIAQSKKWQRLQKQRILELEEQQQAIKERQLIENNMEKKKRILEASRSRSKSGGKPGAMN